MPEDDLVLNPNQWQRSNLKLNLKEKPVTGRWEGWKSRLRCREGHLLPMMARTLPRKCIIRYESRNVGLLYFMPAVCHLLPPCVAATNRPWYADSNESAHPPPFLTLIVRHRILVDRLRERPTTTAESSRFRVLRLSRREGPDNARSRGALKAVWPGKHGDDASSKS
jgi:hypothetical protein